jgi:hypothetical protein
VPPLLTCGAVYFAGAPVRLDDGAPILVPIGVCQSYHHLEVLCAVGLLNK